MPTIRAAHYGETEERLTHDPIVIAMASEIPEAMVTVENNMIHESGQPTSGFMNTCNAEYRRRGGTDGGHIGAVAHAILMLMGMES